MIVLFQPHLYSRTRTFATEFGAAFDLADVVVVTDVYAAREDPDPDGDRRADRRPRADAGQGDVRAGPARRRPRASPRAARPGDLVLTVGAGDVTLLAPGRARRARRRRATGREPVATRPAPRDPAPAARPPARRAAPAATPVAATAAPVAAARRRTARHRARRPPSRRTAAPARVRPRR